MSRVLPGGLRWGLPGVLLVGIVAFTAGCGGSTRTNVSPQTLCNSTDQTTAGACDCGTSAQAGTTNCPAEPSESVGTVSVQDEQSHADVDPALITANNDFGLSVLSTLLSQGATSANPAIASVGLAETLETAYNGAAGTTQQSMAQVLQLGSLTTQQLNADNAALQGALINPDPQANLLIFNSLWADFTDNPPSNAFNQTDTSYYGADFGDFYGSNLTSTATASAPSDTTAANTINGIASFYTYGQVTDVLGASSYTDPTGSVLPVSTVYFQGQWLYPFAASSTHTGGFTVASAGVATSVALMGPAVISAPYLQGSNFQAISLPYGQTARLSMLLVLPQSGTDLNTFVAGITAATIEQWESQMQTQGVNLTLPRFTSGFSGSLQSVLTTLGMGVAFDPDSADFSGIFGGAYLESFQHGVVISVNENGTSVASPSSVGSSSPGGGVSTGPVTDNTMTVNQPFFYAIRDNQTGELLVVGVVTDPNAS